MQYVPFLNDAQIGQALANSFSLWGGNRTHAQVLERFLNLKNSSPSKILSMAGILDPHQNVASALKRYHFELDSPNGPLKTVVLGAIFTREEFRQRGFAKILIDSVLFEEKKMGAKAALLFSDIGTPYYEKFGFQPLQDLRWLAEAAYLLKTPALNLRMAESKDTEKLISWYESSFPPGHLRYRRPNLEIWNFLRQRADAHLDYIVSSKGHDVGYFNAAVAKDTLWVHEYVLNDSALENAFAATLGQFALNNQRDTIAGWLRADNILNGFVGRSRGLAIPMLCALADDVKVPRHDNAIHFSSIDHV